MKPTTLVAQTCLASLVLLCSLDTVAATRFDPSKQPLGSLAPLVLSNTDISSGDGKAYRPWFENGGWQGDVVEYSVAADSTLTTSVDLTGATPANPGASPANWSALVTMKNKVAANASYWDTGREIITAVNGVQKPFRWGSNAIGMDNMSLLDPAAVADGDASSKVLDFLRGKRSDEYPATAALRARASIFGDIIHSNPVYVGAPDSNRTDNGYAAWAQEHINREGRVYVGANDGMLHVLDADDGSEVYAYIPSMVMGNLSKLAGRPFVHAYFVDGKLTVQDAYFDGDWHTVLVGSLGAGGRGIFALDITDPDLDNEAADSGSDLKLLWEVDGTNPDSSNDNDLGYSYSRAVITKLNDGKWYAVVGNGYNSVNGIAMLYVVDIETGDVQKITTGSGSADSPNGLSSPSLLDTDRDGQADYAYAGDIDGNLWKFDLSSDDPDDWTEAYGRPLHPATANQAITMAPEIARHPSKGFLIYFGTGRLYTAADVYDTSTQSFYGIWDSGDTPPIKASQSLLAVTLDGPKTYTSGTISEQVAVYNVDAGDVNWASQHGWQIDLPNGYRVLEGVQLRGARVKVTVTNPATRENWILEAATLDGGPNATPIFDLNADSVLNTNDLVDGNANLLFVDPEDVPMAWKRPNGVMSQVTIGRIANGIDVLYLNYLEPPAKVACTGSCTAGFQGGHVDVDTYADTETYGGGSTQHTHEYDKKVGRVYVDYFDMLATGHVEIDNESKSKIPPTEKFVVLVANGDFSPGSTITIGSKKWNVAEYQREIHVALKNWDATDPNDGPVDSDGDSLIFSWGELKAAGGDIRNAFDDLSLISGGVHPTRTGCVKGGAYQTYNKTTKVGRWRNGALTTQLVRASHFKSNPAIADVDIQKPVDLVEVVQRSYGAQTELLEDFNDNGSIEAANHEIIGGLIAKSGVEHLWESTVFWHYSGGVCYGEANWREEVALALAEANAFDAALATLDITDLGDEINAHVACKDIDNSKGGCKQYYALLLELKKLIDAYVPPEGEIGELGGGGEVPVVVGGGVQNEGVTNGPTFRFGRSSWTDVVPD